MQGAPLRVQVGESGVAINQAAVLAADVEAGNGVIHVLDQVVLPADGFQGFAVFASVKGNTVTLVWPAATGQRQTLEASDNPAGPWSPLAAPTVTYDGVSKVELDATAPMQFFRVASQPAGN